MRKFWQLVVLGAFIGATCSSCCPLYFFSCVDQLVRPQGATDYLLEGSKLVIGDLQNRPEVTPTPVASQESQGGGLDYGIAALAVVGCALLGYTASKVLRW